MLNWIQGNYKSTGMNPNNYYTKKEIDSMGSLKFEKVDTLPTENIDTKAIYLLPNDDGTHNEYVYVNGNWELLGGGGIYVIDLENPNFEEIKKHEGEFMLISLDGVVIVPLSIIMEDTGVCIYVSTITNVGNTCGGYNDSLRLIGGTYIIRSNNDISTHLEELILWYGGAANSFLAADGNYHEIDISDLENRITALEEQLGKITTNVAVIKMTQADYDALAEKDPDTVYIIQG